MPDDREPVLDPAYWAARLRLGIEREGMHRAVFEVGTPQWLEVVERRRRNLIGLIGDGESVLDVGCAWGWTRGCVPPGYMGRWVGVDVCPEFIDMAGRDWPGCEWHACDARRMPFRDGEFDVAVMGAFKGLLMRHTNAWPDVEREVRRVARRMVELEYSE